MQTFNYLELGQHLCFVLLVGGLSFIPAAAQSSADESESAAQPRVKHTTSFELEQSVEVLFPLFSPEGETLWVPGWEYENVMGTTELAEDYVFVTQAHDHASAKAVWLTKRYEPEQHLVQFYKVEPENKVGIVTVQCQELEAGTRVEVTYEYIALSDQGHEFIENFTQEAYAEFIGEWETLLHQYFANGPVNDLSAPAPD